MSSVKLNEEEKRLLHNAWHHFLTITHHKLVVMEGCFKVGLFKQGLLHDLSKYSWEEFKPGVKYYQGTRSPNAAEKEEKGYSSAWLHHKGRNKHHFEYWTDVSTAEDHWKIVGVKMPVNYLAEMVMDRIAASKIYQGRNYTDAAPYTYFSRNKEYIVMHPETKACLDKILLMLKEKGERKTFAYIRILRSPGRLLLRCGKAEPVYKRDLLISQIKPANPVSSHISPAACVSCRRQRLCCKSHSMRKHA